MMIYRPFVDWSKLAGAGIVWLMISSAADAEEAITFNKQVAPILWKSCAGCHHSGEVAPFPLLTYQDAFKRAEFLKEITAKRLMPPWKPQNSHGEFHDDRSLSEEEIRTIARWADTGAKEGDPQDLPAQPKFADGWKFGKPDLVFSMPEPFTVPASGAEILRCFVIPTDVKERMTVAGVEFRPGNRRVVHHANFYLDYSGEAKKIPSDDLGPGFTRNAHAGFVIGGKLGAWVPGSTPFLLPEGIGRLLGAKADLVMQIHYHPSGKEEQDRSTVAVYLTKKPAENLVAEIGLHAGQLAIPAGQKHHRAVTSYTLPVDIQVISIAPHMHLLGREMKVVAKLPDGKERSMISIDDWDFNWQGHYRYRKPVRLPKGTTLELEAYFDNSDANPKNPNSPPKIVRGGTNTTDEMCQCNILTVTDDPNERRTLMRDFAEKSREKRGVGKKSNPLPTPP